MNTTNVIKSYDEFVDKFEDHIRAMIDIVNLLEVADDVDPNHGAVIKNDMRTKIYDMFDEIRDDSAQILE